MSCCGNNPYEFNPPSDMPEGFGADLVNLGAQNFFMNFQGIPKTFSGQLMYVGPIIHQLNEDLEWYMNTFNDLKNSSKMFPDIEAVSECKIQPAFKTANFLRF